MTEIVVTATPESDPSPDSGISETAAVAAGHAEAEASHAVEAATEAEVEATNASQTAEVALSVADNTNERMSALEVQVGALVASNVAMADTIAQLRELAELNAQATLVAAQPEPEKPTPDTTPKSGGWYNRKITR
jgi:hypothetical protein